MKYNGMVCVMLAAVIMLVQCFDVEAGHRHRQRSSYSSRGVSSCPNGVCPLQSASRVQVQSRSQVQLHQSGVPIVGSHVVGSSASTKTRTKTRTSTAGVQSIAPRLAE